MMTGMLAANSGQAGVGCTRLVGSSCRRLASAGALLAIEGNNEPNNWGITLHGNQTWLNASPGSDSPVDGLYKNYGRTWHHRFAGYSETELLAGNHSLFRIVSSSSINPT